MAITILAAAKDRSTYVVTAAFTDDADAAVVPDTLTWTLTDGSGTVVNDRLDVSETPAASFDIVLSGADLAYADGGTRVLTIEATYTSDAGAGLPLNAACTFSVEDLEAVA